MSKHLKFIDKKLIKEDFYTTEYFKHTVDILKNSTLNHQTSTMQFKSFHNEPYMVCGVYECIEIIKARLSKKAFDQLEIYYYEDGTIIQPHQCVLSIKGPYILIAPLENILDGVLARRSSVANNCYQFLKYLKPNELVYMSDRSDDYHLIPYNGYSAYVGGIRQFSNEADVYFLKNQSYKIFGSIPHALIQQFDGDIVQTFKQYKKTMKDNLTMLVDYDNDIIDTLIKLKPFLSEINAIRVDTSDNMIDKSLVNRKDKDINNYYGSNHELMVLIRNWLDSNDAKHIKIICSSNNDLNKIKAFKKLKTPVDCYGIGTNLTKLNLHFTADLVMNDDQKQAKVGRQYIDVKGMKKYQHEKFSF